MEEDQPRREVSQSSNKTTILAVGVIVAIALLGFAIFAVTGSTKQKDDNQASAANQVAVNPNATYKDGKYSAVGSYTSPGGQEKITIDITVKDGVVTDTSATSGAIDPQGEQYQSQFISGYKSEVIGKKLSTLSLTRVSGSSLTPKGFNDALEQIRTQAQT